MKIDSISNLTTYSPGMAQRNQASNAKAVPQEQKAQASSTGGVSSGNGLTSAERQYFAKLFPDSSGQISSHKTYSPTGMNAPTQLGQIINRKA